MKIVMIFLLVGVACAWPLSDEESRLLNLLNRFLNSDVSSDTKERGTSTGTVKWFNEEKGFGYITQDNGGPDVFVHFQAIVMEGFKTLTKGQRVSYTVDQTQIGPQAESVVPM